MSFIDVKLVYRKVAVKKKEEEREEDYKQQERETEITMRYEYGKFISARKPVWSVNVMLTHRAK